MMCRKGKTRTKSIKKEGGNDMDLQLVTPQKNAAQKFNDWPSHIPVPTSDDLDFLGELSRRNTGSDFFDTKKRSDSNGNDRQE